MSFLGQLFGDKELSDIDKSIDSLIGNIGLSKKFENIEDSTGKIMDSFINDINTKESDELSFLNSLQVPKERLSRYSLYDEVLGLSIIKRIMKVYLSNTMPKNPVNTKAMVIRETKKQISPNDEKMTKKVKSFTEEFIEQFKISEKLKKYILPKQFIYGDFFVEVVDIKKESENFQEKLSNNFSLLNESINMIDTSIDFSNNEIDKLYTNLINCLIIEGNNFPIKTLKHAEGEIKENTFSNVLIKTHDPHNIIILDTKFGVRLGYLEIKQSKNSEFSSNAGLLSTLVNKISSISKQNKFNDDDIVDKLSLKIINKIISSSMNSNNNDVKDIKSVVDSLDDNVINFIKRVLINQDLLKNTNVQQIKVRFIPATRLIHFSNPSGLEHIPYSESIVDNLIFPAKLYMLAQLSNTVNKLSRASLIRTWTIDVGSSKMHSQLIQKLKRELYNSRITLDDLSSFKNIPKIFSDFRDMFILQKQGNKPLDVQVQNFGDSNLKVDDLRDSRNEIVALSGIPSSHLNLQDTVELREQLTHANINFANEIMDIQENIVNSLNKLIDAVADVCGKDYKPSDFISIGLIPPIILILQLIETTLTSIGSISNTFTSMNIQIDPYYFLNQYIPYIDWDKFKEKAQKFVSENKAKSSIINSQ